MSEVKAQLSLITPRIELRPVLARFQRTLAGLIGYKISLISDEGEETKLDSTSSIFGGNLYRLGVPITVKQVHIGSDVVLGSIGLELIQDPWNGAFLVNSQPAVESHVRK